MLMRRIIDYARARGTKEIYGDVLSDNRPMLKLCRALGFRVEHMPDDPGVMIVTLKL
jgi:acetyltransferase